MRSVSSVAVCALVLVLSLYTHARGKELTCGQELAVDSEVPEKLSKLMAHVATNMEVHARWVGGEGAGKQEHDSLMVVAQEYRAIAEAAGRAASAMQAMKDTPPAPHDPARLDRAGQALWMRAKIQMQTELAQMLMRHAETSKKVLAEMERGGAGR